MSEDTGKTQGRMLRAALGVSQEELPDELMDLIERKVEESGKLEKIREVMREARENGENEYAALKRAYEAGEIPSVWKEAGDEYDAAMAAKEEINQ